MLTWISRNWGNILVILILSGVVALIVFCLVKTRRSGKLGCGCNCSACSLSEKCHSPEKH